jgi:hypothetical protein
MLLIISSLTSLSTMSTASEYRLSHGNNIMASPIYAQRIVLSDASKGKALLYWTRNLECETCLTKTFSMQGRDFYLKFVVPRKAEAGKIFASFKILPECHYDIELIFAIQPSGQFILPTGNYLSTPDNRNGRNCGPAVPMNVTNGDDVTYISWG